ncbi:MAG: pyrroline-5-carboxylate reductase [Opitutaceae bacterium]|nr:pyrroline-5-carboxylate reductase [Opitutaceae bacterium]
MTTHIAFIGAGRMASAIIDGLINQKVCAPAAIAVLGGAGPSASALAARTGVRLAADLPDLVRDADLVVVAFKPQHLAGADHRLAELTRGKLVLSVLAAKTLARLAKTFPHARNLVRTMPNTPAAIGAGVTGWAALRALSEADRATVVAVLRALGREIELPEDQIDALMAVSGCGPAFVFEFTAALREAGVACGLAPAIADLLARETVVGAAKLMAHTGTEPEELRNQVTSPKGTTYAGLQVLAARDFRGLMRDTALASKARSAELSAQE